MNNNQKSDGEPWHYTQLIGKEEAWLDQNCGSGLMAALANSLATGEAINDRRTGQVRERARVWHFMAVKDELVSARFTVWRQWDNHHAEEFRDMRDVVRMTDGFHKPEECLRLGCEVCGLEDASPMNTEPVALIAANLYHEVLCELCARRRPAMAACDFSLVRVLKTIPGPKWVWSEWVI